LPLNRPHYGRSRSWPAQPMSSPYHGQRSPWAAHLIPTPVHSQQSPCRAQPKFGAAHYQDTASLRLPHSQPYPLPSRPRLSPTYGQTSPWAAQPTSRS
jgi:hypothetical protein